jgi:outer membrane biosynthesis protein TonB
MKTLYLLALVSVLASGCMRAAAKTTPDAPPLDMPAPPPREMEPNEAEAPQPVPLISEPARNTPQRPRPTPPQQAPKIEPPKPEPPKPEPPPPIIEPAKPPEEPPRPPTTLQTTPATAEGEVERGIRESLSRATSALNRIDYRVLNADAKIQYDTAKRWIRQSEDALRTKNLVFAKEAATKAAALAAQLGGR